MEFNDVRFISLGPIVFELSACENSAEFPAESGCKAHDLTRYKVDTARRVLPYIDRISFIPVKLSVICKPLSNSLNEEHTFYF